MKKLNLCLQYTHLDYGKSYEPILLARSALPLATRCRFEYNTCRENKDVLSIVFNPTGGYTRMGISD